jgi:hypothetical protein
MAFLVGHVGYLMTAENLKGKELAQNSNFSAASAL